MIVLTILALLVMVFTLKDYSSKKRTRLIDFLLFFITGLLGLLLLFLWFGTHHSTTINNMNILWAFAPNVVVAFVLLKKRTPVWVRVYTLLMVILLLAAVLVWVFQLQNFNAAMIPFMLMLAFRYVFLWQKGCLQSPDLNGKTSAASHIQDQYIAFFTFRFFITFGIVPRQGKFKKPYGSFIKDLFLAFLLQLH